MTPAVFIAVVHGPSMVPALRHGDLLLVRRTHRARPGDVVVVGFAGRDGLYVKRAVRPMADGWWVEGDNRHASDDSRSYGIAAVSGRALLRLWPRPRGLCSGQVIG